MILSTSAENQHLGSFSSSIIFDEFVLSFKIFSQALLCLVFRDCALGTYDLKLKSGSKSKLCDSK